MVFTAATVAAIQPPSAPNGAIRHLPDSLRDNRGESILAILATRDATHAS